MNLWQPLYALLRWLTLIGFLLCAASPVLAAKTYAVNGDGTATDPTTGLTWMRCAIGQTWTGSTCSGSATTSDTFAQANAYTGTVIFAGHSDWRLPTLRELATLADRTTYGPAIDAQAFPNTPASLTRSASLFPNHPEAAWYVNFQWGSIGYDLTNKASAVRLVRGGQSAGLLDMARPNADYVNQSDGTVTHTPTGLTWQRCAVGQSWTGSTCSGTASSMSWDAALLQSSNFAGQTDWRLPTEEELGSLVDYTLSTSPLINTTSFPGTPSSYFWSASPRADYSSSSAFGNAWYVYFSSGISDSRNRGSVSNVRLVRSGPSASTLTLSISTTGSGSGTVTGSGINCSSSAAATSGICTVTLSGGSTVTLTATATTGSSFGGWGGACSGTALTCTLSNITTATSVTASFTLAALTAQTITFGPAPVVQVGGTGSVSATASSGLSVSLHSLTPAVCSLSGSASPATVSALTTGTCTIAADQSGTSSISPATQKTLSFMVTATATASGRYTKIANSGSDLPADAALGSSAAQWACTRDNTTGLTWEGKTDAGAHLMSKTYTNYDSSYGTSSQINASNNSLGFVSAMNAARLCGAADWRMPTKDELLSLVNTAYAPTIDPTYFPFTRNANFWSSTPSASFASDAWFVNFGNSPANTATRFMLTSVRLVRGAQPASPTGFSGSRNNYSLVKTSSGFNVIDKASGSTTALTGAAWIQFADVKVNLLIGDLSKTIAPSDLKTLIELYVAFFNRVPDADGLAYWIGQFKGGMSLDKIADNFYSAAIAYTNLTGYSASMSNADFVRIIYDNVLGRDGPTAPSTAEVAYWANKLTDASATKGSLVSTMLVSAHSFAGDPTWGWVSQLLDNKLTVATLFAVWQGLNYNTAAESIVKGMAIAAAVTSASIANAVSLMDITDTGFNLTFP